MPFPQHPPKTKPQPFLSFLEKQTLRRFSILMGLLAILGSWAWGTMGHMPGHSFRGSLPPLTAQELQIKSSLQTTLEQLETIGPKNAGAYEALEETRTWFIRELEHMGYTVYSQDYKIGDRTFANLVVEQTGQTQPTEIVVVGAHYDSAFTAPGINDNGSGAAAVLEMARFFHNQKIGRTLRLVEFTNEEPPFFATPNMGSARYAAQLKQNGENVVAMLSLDELGYFTNEPHSQHYPLPTLGLYPNQGNFISFVGNFKSRRLLRNAIATFRHQAQFPSEGVVAPEWITGISWSDHGSFWNQGYPAIMVTDTAPFRYPYYHTLEDTLDKVNVEHLARVTQGLMAVVQQLTIDSQ